MKLFVYNEPTPHIILDDVYSDADMQTMLDEMRGLRSAFKPPEETGSARGEDRRPLKTNHGLYLEDNHSDSVILKLNRRAFDRVTFVALQSLFPQVKLDNWYSNTLINYYDDGQEYKPHVDTSTFTFITFFEREHDGGDFVFADYNYTVEQRPNRIVVFEGKVKHAVTPIRFTDKTKEGRYSMAQFLFARRTHDTRACNVGNA